MLAFSRFSFYFLLFLFAVFWFAIGCDSPTSLTGKDEFFLGLRTPLFMIEKDVWLIPILDDLPRIRKPPLLYWCGRFFYETFGISLFSIRFMACVFSAFFVLGAAACARALGINKTHALLLALLLMSSLGLKTESARVMLDIPVSCFSIWAFWTFLKAAENRLYLLLGAIFLALGFLTKGPVVFVLFFSGIAALFCSNILSFQLFFNLKNNLWILCSFLLWAILALPWFFWVRFLYPDFSSDILNNELAHREFFKINLTPFSALFVLSMPWFFIGINACWKVFKKSKVNIKIFSKKIWVDRGNFALFIALWLIFSILPFCFIRTFERYLIGSLIPFCFLILLFFENVLNQNWAKRLGFILSFVAAFLLLVFVVYFKNNTHLILIFLCALILFFLAWWKNKNIWLMVFSALIFWQIALSVIYPQIGVNAVPQKIIDHAKQNEVVFFAGPQPAMLSILSGKAHRHFGAFQQEDFHFLKNKTIFVSEFDFPLFLKEIEKFNTHFKIHHQFKTLVSTGSGLRFAKIGATLNDWLDAFSTHCVAPISTTIYAVKLSDENPQN